MILTSFCQSNDSNFLRNSSNVISRVGWIVRCPRTAYPFTSPPSTWTGLPGASRTVVDCVAQAALLLLAKSCSHPRRARSPRGPGPSPPPPRQALVHRLPRPAWPSPRQHPGRHRGRRTQPPPPSVPAGLQDVRTPPPSEENTPLPTSCRSA